MKSWVVLLKRIHVLRHSGGYNCDGRRCPAGGVVGHVVVGLVGQGVLLAGWGWGS